MTVFRTQWFENIFVRSFKIYRQDDKTDKAFKMRPVIDHLNSKFFEVLSNDSEQSIDKQMVSFKGRFGMKQYTKSKPIKWGFKFWFRCLSKSGYLYQMDVYLGRKQTPAFNLGFWEEVVLQLTKDLEQSFCTVYFDNFFNSPKLIEKMFQKAFMVLEQFNPTERKCQKWSTISRLKGKIEIFSFQVIQWFENGWKIGQYCFYHLPLKEWMIEN